MASQIDAPLTIGKGVLDGVRRKLVDDEPEGNGNVGWDFQRLGLHGDLDQAVGSEKARPDAAGDPHEERLT
jgi:hypothetical protein